MKRSTAAWTVTATAAAFLALPPASAAQGATQPPATTQSSTQPATSATGDNAAAQEQLRQAQAALNDVTTVTLSARAKTQVAELKRRLTALERNSKATNKTWGNEVAAMDKIIATLLDNGATPTGTSGSTAAASKPAASTNLDDASREKLTEVRTALTAYAAAMSGQPAASTAPASSAASSASTSATPAEPSSTTPAEPTSTPAQSAAAPAGSAAATQSPAGEAAQAQQPDEQAARKHLTEARNTLSEMTQLPAAAQLTGDARTQISQLISNFNELITTQSDWRASYAKVSANLTALIGPDSGTPDPSTASGTAGAVGTSGTTPVNIDPAVRGKLVELRKHLAEFERVATGGGASSSATTPSASSSATTPSASSSTTTPSASGSTTTPSASGTTEPSTASSAAAAPQAESLRLIAAIESMLKSQNEGGGLTLDKTQADMLRTHLADLKRLLEVKK